MGLSKNLMIPGKIKSVFLLLRVRQYYKNMMIFVGIFFSKNLFETTYYFNIVLGFILLCCASSFNYIINDIKDIENDKKHPEKLRKKPLASGEIPIYFAIIVLIILVCLMITFPFFIINFDARINFVFTMILMIITGQLYNFFFKNIAFIDIIILSLGYLWRALAGCFVINKFVSPWLFLAIFEVAMFLSIAKRKGDLELLGKEKAIEHKKIYDQYSGNLLDQFHIIIAGSLFMTYSLYLILIFNLFGFEPENIAFYEYSSIFTIPIALYIIMRYMYLTSAKPKMVRNPEKAFIDKGIMIAGFFIFIMLFFSFYFNIFFNN